MRCVHGHAMARHQWVLRLRVEIWCYFSAPIRRGTFGSDLDPVLTFSTAPVAEYSALPGCSWREPGWGPCDRTAHLFAEPLRHGHSLTRVATPTYRLRAWRWLDCGAPGSSLLYGRLPSRPRAGCEPSLEAAVLRGVGPGSNAFRLLALPILRATGRWRPPGTGAQKYYHD